jgi:anti-sigma regulatory factor (Ser/Thr protein kinase)
MRFTSMPIPCPSPTQASTTLPVDRESPYRARRFVADHLTAWGCDEVREVVALLVSELVTNGVTHASTPVGLAVGCDGETVTIAVTDGVPGGIGPCTMGQARGALSGRGLHIVDVLADRWGVAVHDSGKTIWFAVTTAAQEVETGA